VGRACEVEGVGNFGDDQNLPSAGNQLGVAAAADDVETSDEGSAPGDRTFDYALAAGVEVETEVVVGQDQGQEVDGGDSYLTPVGGSRFDSVGQEEVYCQSCSEPCRTEQAGRTGRSWSGNDPAASECQRCWQRQRRAGPGRTDWHWHSSSRTLSPVGKSSPTWRAVRRSGPVQGARDPLCWMVRSYACSEIPTGASVKAVVALGETT
jgi:hypothetical protein